MINKENDNIVNEVNKETMKNDKDKIVNKVVENSNPNILREKRANAVSQVEIDLTKVLAKAEADKIAIEKAKAQKVANEKALAEKIAAEKIAAEKAAIAKAAEEAEEAALKKEIAEKIASQKALAEKIASQKALAEKIAAEKIELAKTATDEVAVDSVEVKKVVTEKPVIQVKKPVINNNKNKSKNRVKVIPLGGLGEVGKNITAIEYGDEIVLIDCGLAFPEADMYGVDLVLPDVSYLIKNQEKVKCIVLTHGHEDHIGALPYVLKDLNVPVYGTKLTINLVKSKLEEHSMASKCILNEVKLTDKVKTEHFTVEFIRTCHSIADSCALAITTPEGVIVHTGDFKIDHTPGDGELFDFQKFAQIGKRKVLLLMSDSTNVERPGYTVSEKIIGENLTKLFARAKGRVIVATFASNVSRVQQIINSSLVYGRKVAFSGRSMERISTIAMDLGYLEAPEGTIVTLDDVNKYPSDQITIITTGSQGEPMAALSRIAASNHRKITLEKEDFIIISASPIPGNKKVISRLIDDLIAKGAEVIYNDIEEVHVSGHAFQEELKLIQALLKPRFFMPVHGEYRHLRKHGLLAESMGMDSKDIFLLETGEILELTRKTAKKAGKVTSGSIMVDGSGIGDVGSIVLRDRKSLSKDGILTVVITIDRETYSIASGPDIISRGFIYIKESGDLIREATRVTRTEVEKCLDKQTIEWNLIKSNIRSELGHFLYTKTGRRPIIMPIIMEI